MTDEYEPDHPHSVDDSATSNVDPAALAWVEKTLGDLAFLRPDGDQADPAEAPSSAPAMPDDVWRRLQQALSAEPAPTAAIADSAADSVAAPREAAAALAVEAPIAEVVSLDSRRQPSRAARWAGGLAAASVAVVAVGFGVTAFQGTGGSAIVAGDAPATSAPAAEAFTAEAPAEKSADGAASAEDAAAMSMAVPSAGASAPTSETAPDTSVLEGPQTMSFAGMVPPVLRLVQSDTDYTEGDLRGQVTEVLSDVGLTEPEAVVEAVSDPATAVEMPADPMPGFLATSTSLRDCITKLTSETSSTALMVDMATFEGQQAGVVVAPDYPMAEAQQSEPEVTTLEVWVVDPECDITMKLRLRSVGTP